MSTIHEVGHLLDWHGIPGEGSAANTESALVEEWWKAVSQSQKYKDVETSKMPEEDKKYLLKRSELFAQSYAQYIATQTGDRNALCELRMMQANNPDLVWADEDFEPIRKAWVALCKKMKWSA